MTTLQLDGNQFSDLDSYLLAALTLSAATGRPFEMVDIGARATPGGITPFHLTAIQMLAPLCGAEVKGEAVGARKLRFAPTRPPRAQDLSVDTGAATGRPSPASVTPLIEAAIAVLGRTEGEALLRFRGANATPFAPSAFWLREVYTPMLHWLGLEAAVEVERWGWYPDGGGETTLLVEGSASEPPRGHLLWEERGDPVALWAVAALSARMEGRIGEQMGSVLRRELARDPLGAVESELRRVRSPGPGSGLFVALQFEQVTAGFEGVSYRGMGPEQVAEGVAAAVTQFFWSDAALEPELARALMIPIALSGHSARFTTSELTLPMRILEDLIPRFLPAQIRLDKSPTGGRISVESPEHPLSIAQE